MPIDVVMPQMGESIFEGTITKWLKKTGDVVQKDEPLFEISTDKVDAEIPSPAAGVLSEIKAPEGSIVEVNAVVAIVAESAEQTATASAGQGPCGEAHTCVFSQARARKTGNQISPTGRREGGRQCGSGDAADGRVDFRRHHHPLAQESRRPGPQGRAAV